MPKLSPIQPLPEPPCLALNVSDIERLAMLYVQIKDLMREKRLVPGDTMRFAFMSAHGTEAKVYIDV